MHLKQILLLEIKKSNIPNAGLGLFTTIDRKKGDLLTYYTGERLTKEEADASESKYIWQLQPTKDIYIDSIRTDEFGLGRFINDAKSIKKNNCKFAWNGKTQITAIRAIKDIKAGNELYLSYGRDFWRNKKQTT